MPSASRFYLSMYVTLGLACACLGYSELAFLPEMSVFALVVGGLLIIAYQVEGRWSLTIPAANFLGGVIAAGAAVWVAYQFFRPWGGTLLDHLPWPTSLLPYLGPLLMILVPAKLFRPKHTGDFWGLQGVGLIAVALGCALAGDAFFAVLLMAYLVSAMWSLTLFYYYRENLRSGAAGARTRRLASPPTALGQAGRWSIIVALPAMVLFLGTPRSGEARWELTLNSVRLQTGIDETRPGIDLNRNGQLRINRDLVFEVIATDAKGAPKTDLDPNQRWRGRVFNFYEDGRWGIKPLPQDDAQARAAREGNAIGPLIQPPPALPEAIDPPPPPLQSDEFMLEFRPQPRFANSRVLAEPVTSPSRTDQRFSTVFSKLDERQPPLPWTRVAEGELRPQQLVPAHSTHIYIQRVTPRPDPPISPPIADDENWREHLRNYQSVPALREWTHMLIQRLIEQGRLPAEVQPLPKTIDSYRVDPMHYERVARAFEWYLSQSGDYKYTLNLSRHDAKLDPVEDFLLNTRAGHCNRFATALTLLLRTVGVPTRIVLGYHGVASDGEVNRYVVRQSQAHSWVEAMIQRSDGGRPTWRWLTLDPTPVIGEEETAESQWSFWWESTRTSLATFFKNFVVEYDSDQQGRAYSLLSSSTWEAAYDGVKRALFGADGDDWLRASEILAGSILSIGIAWRLWRRSAFAKTPPIGSIPFHDRLLKLLDHYTGLKQRIGQTPSEFAGDVAALLQKSPALRSFAALPHEVVLLFYRVRFGNRPLNDQERESLDARVDRFEAALVASAAVR